MKNINFTNKRSTTVELLVEPAAEAIELKPNQMAEIQILDVGKYLDPLEIVYDDDFVTIYEGREMQLKIYVDGELIYFT